MVQYSVVDSCSASLHACQNTQFNRLPFPTAASPTGQEHSNHLSSAIAFLTKAAFDHWQSLFMSLYSAQVSVTEQLLALDNTNTPLWSTFCGLTNGVWQGKMAAFYAATGLLLTLNADINCNPLWIFPFQIQNPQTLAAFQVTTVYEVLA